MKKWLKNWWFSILMFACAVAITLWVVIGCFNFTSDDEFVYTLLVINSISPVLLLIIIGSANAPKGDKGEKESL